MRPASAIRTATGRPGRPAAASRPAAHAGHPDRVITSYSIHYTKLYDFLNVRGHEQVLKSMHEVYASLFNDRAIAYRVHQGFDHSQVAISVGVQHMIRSDLGASGVMFTLDTESGFRGVIFITASYGLA